jgi:hypothetical protein
VLGVHVALEAPSSLSVALCLELACLPKDRPGIRSPCEAPWMMFGLPKEILVDNVPEFHGAALERGCCSSRLLDGITTRFIVCWALALRDGSFRGLRLLFGA